MRKRLALILPTYGVLYALCFVAAFLLRFDFQLPEIYQPVIVLGLPIVLSIKFCICLATGEWRRTYRYTTVTDLFNLIVGSATAAGVSYLVLQLALGTLPLPRTVLLIDAMLSVLAVGLLRVGIRVINERIVRAGHERRALILGVDPDHQGKGLGGALLQPALAKADQEGLPCYLETLEEKNLAFYGRHGFEVLVDDREPHSGLKFWTMIRS